MNYAPGGMFGGMYGQAPMTSAGGWNTANAGGSNLRLQDDMGGWFPPGMYSKGPGLRSNFGMPSQASMNSDAMMRQNFMRGGMARFGGGGMFGGMDGGQMSQSYGQPQGYGAAGGGLDMFAGGSANFNESTGRSVPQLRSNDQAANGARVPQMSTGYTVNEPMPQTGGSFNPMVGSQTPQMSQPYQSNMSKPMMMQGPQMSQPYQSNMNKPMMMQGPQMSQPFQSTQQQAPVQQARPQQSFEDFASTLSGSGMTSGQMNDLYQKQIAKASAPTNFWQNVGPGGTQNPFPQSPQPFPQNWGQQRFNFDPRSLAGQQVTGDVGWYYGRDAIGRQINAQGDAVPTFRSPADGFQRTRPWFGGM